MLSLVLYRNDEGMQVTWIAPQELIRGLRQYGHPVFFLRIFQRASLAFKCDLQGHLSIRSGNDKK